MFIDDKEIRKKLGYVNSEQSYFQVRKSLSSASPEMLRRFKAYLRINRNFWDDWTRTINQFKYSFSLSLLTIIITGFVLHFLAHVYGTVVPELIGFSIDIMIFVVMGVLWYINHPTMRVLEKKSWVDLMSAVIDEIEDTNLPTQDIEAIDSRRNN